MEETSFHVTALRVGAHRRFRDHWLALQVAGCRRAPVENKGNKTDDLIRFCGLVAPRGFVPGSPDLISHNTLIERV